MVETSNSGRVESKVPIVDGTNAFEDFSSKMALDADIVAFVKKEVQGGVTSVEELADKIANNFKEIKLATAMAGFLLASSLGLSQVYNPLYGVPNGAIPNIAQAESLYGEYKNLLSLLGIPENTSFGIYKDAKDIITVHLSAGYVTVDYSGAERRLPKDDFWDLINLTNGVVPANGMEMTFSENNNSLTFSMNPDGTVNQPFYNDGSPVQFFPLN